MTARAHKCRLCGAALEHVFADLGTMPLANSFLEPEALGRPEPTYPLIVRLCAQCFLVQADEAVPAEAIFSDYAYFSSYASSWVEHTRAYAEAMRRRLGLGSRSKVVEIASNDGCLLRHFVATGVPVLGVEPAANVAAVAVAAGVPTDVAFFGRKTAARLLSEGHAADLMAANNVLAHVPDLNDFVAGFKILLRPEGTATFEFPHLLRLIEETQFDTMYHEHYSYFSLRTAERLLRSHGLQVFDVERLPTHGGSLRLFAGHAEAERPEAAGLSAVRAAETAGRLGEVRSYLGFQDRIDGIRGAFLRFLDEARGRRARVAAYGAAAKGNTLLNYCGVRADRIEYVVDRNPRKQGRYLPGSHLPVLPPERLFETKPDYVVVLPWNLAGEIGRDLAGIAAWGGRLVTAIPEVRVWQPGGP